MHATIATLISSRLAAGLRPIYHFKCRGKAKALLYRFDYLAWNKTLWLWGKYSYFLSNSRHPQPHNSSLCGPSPTVLNCESCSMENAIARMKAEAFRRIQFDVPIEAAIVNACGCTGRRHVSVVLLCSCVCKRQMINNLQARPDHTHDKLVFRKWLSEFFFF